MAQRMSLACLQGQRASGEQVPALHSLDPQNLDMALEKGLMGPETDRVHFYRPGGQEHNVQSKRVREKNFKLYLLYI